MSTRRVEKPSAESLGVYGAHAALNTARSRGLEQVMDPSFEVVRRPQLEMPSRTKAGPSGSMAKCQATSLVVV